jgi:hypothetical protein
MSNKIYTAIAIIAFLILFTLFFLAKQQKVANAPAETETTRPQSVRQAGETEINLKDREEPFKRALQLVIEKKEAGTDFTNGPCLGSIGDGWVVDIVNDPRTAVDDKPQNQCADLKNGKATHFFEFSTEGKLLRAL